MIHAHNAYLERLAGVPFAAAYRLPTPAPPPNPFRPDADTVFRAVRQAASPYRPGSW